MDGGSARADEQRPERRCEAVRLYRVPGIAAGFEKRGDAGGSTNGHSAGDTAVCETPDDVVPARSGSLLAGRIRRRSRDSAGGADAGPRATGRGILRAAKRRIIRLMRHDSTTLELLRRMSPTCFCA